MWGLRGLYNFGKWGKGKQQQPPPIATSSTRVKVVDEDQHEGEEEGEGGEMPTGLKGRWSAGGEVYFSAQERSAGLSTGLRFSTLPDSVLGGGGAVSQPPTTVTATLNPIMGQLSTAYAVQTSKDSTLASRFDFNMYSYDADLTVGGEWFQRKNSNKKGKPTKLSNHTGVEDEFEGTTKRDTFDAFGRGVQEGESTTAVLNRLNNNDAEDEVTAVLKVRASTNSVSFFLYFIFFFSSLPLLEG
jgi:distribution and morphology protein 10